MVDPVKARKGGSVIERLKGGSVNEPVRVGLLGFALESNRFAPLTTAVDFAEGLDLHGPPWLGWLRQGGEDAFCDELDHLRPWLPVPLLGAIANSGGPCEGSFAAALIERVRAALLTAAPLHAVYLLGHGAATSTTSDSLDADVVAAVRAIVGPSVPLVMLTDFHANLPDRLLEQADLVVGYRTNPHVDMLERSRECARGLHRLLGGWRPQKAWRRLPLLIPQVAQLTTAPAPLAAVFDELEAAIGNEVPFASIWPGFSLVDVPHAGVIAYALADDAATAAAVASRLAARVWALRESFKPALVPLDAAMRRAASHTGDTPLILADVADNPGGGGLGCTRWLLHALLEAGVDGVLAGLHHAPQAVVQAQQAGVGASFELLLNADTETLGPPIAASARVLALGDGRYTGRHGMGRGQAMQLGEVAVLQIDGLTLVLNVLRQQILGADAFESLGLSAAQARVLVLKSRGHFRAGFAHLVQPEHIVEVDAPGLTSPMFERFSFTRLPRPIHPLDVGVTWTP